MNKSNRIFENERIVENAISEPTGIFEHDLINFVSWCADSGRKLENHREKLGMMPEPFAPSWSKDLSEFPTKDRLRNYTLSVVEKDLASWQWLYENLADRASKDILINVISHRINGWRFVPMPLDTAAFWNVLAELAELERSSKERIDAGSMNIQLAKMNLSPYGHNVSVFTDAFGCFNEFIYSQYEYRGGQKHLGLRPGDHAIDCGACFGGTSIHFADMVGPEGKVMSFEFFDNNIEVFNKNVAENKELRDRIDLVRAPVWSRDGITMRIHGSGPATQVHAVRDEKLTGALGRIKKAIRAWQSERRGDVQVHTKTIDTSVRERNWDRLDFIKMDIEGAELAALRGAEHSICKHRPLLAICVYHGLRDFFEIPQYLEGLGVGYEFFLQHGTVHGDETVLFASARE